MAEDRLRASSSGARKIYPSEAEGYELLGCIGKGASGMVMHAKCVATEEEVAIKVIDLEHCQSNSLEALRKEIQAMSLCNHPNVVCYHTSFVHNQSLWLVMDFLSGGSCSDIIRFAFPHGLEEHLIATILRETLKGICYFHKTGRIHRDIKAGNILIDGDGCIQIGDFGVSACLVDNGEKSRHTFVGTPCWMAPEIMEQVNYDYSVDIWSFGITALELAKGRAPFSEYPPMKVLLLTLQNAPPTLEADSETEKGRFSGSFKDLIEKCLVKDPSRRPQAHKLLEHKFFKHAKKPDYLVQHMLRGIPPLMERYKMMSNSVTSSFSLFRTSSQALMFPENAQAIDELGPKWDFSDNADSASNFHRKSLPQASLQTHNDLGSSGEYPAPPRTEPLPRENGVHKPNQYSHANGHANGHHPLAVLTPAMTGSTPSLHTSYEHPSRIGSKSSVRRSSMTTSVDGINGYTPKSPIVMQKMPRLNGNQNQYPAPNSISPTSTPAETPIVTPVASPLSSAQISPVNSQLNLYAITHASEEEDHDPNHNARGQVFPRRGSMESIQFPNHHLQQHVSDMPSHASNPDFLSATSGDDHDESVHKSRRHRGDTGEETRHRKHHHKHHHKHKDSKDKEHQEQIQALEQQVHMLTMLVQQGQQQQQMMQLMLSRFQGTTSPTSPVIEASPSPVVQQDPIPMMDMLTSLQSQVATLRKENESLKHEPED